MTFDPFRSRTFQIGTDPTRGSDIRADLYGQQLSRRAEYDAAAGVTATVGGAASSILGWEGSFTSLAEAPFPKMTIVRDDTGDSVQCQFNPTDFTEKVEAVYARLTVPGLSHQVLHFSHTNNDRFSFELYFDAIVDTKASSTVALIYARNFISSMCYPKGTATSIANAGPPKATFIWGDFINLTAVITSAEFKYNSFERTALNPTRMVAKVELEEIRNVFLASSMVQKFGTIRLSEGDSSTASASASTATPAATTTPSNTKTKSAGGAKRGVARLVKKTTPTTPAPQTQNGSSRSNTSLDTTTQAERDWQSSFVTGAPDTIQVPGDSDKSRTVGRLAEPGIFSGGEQTIVGAYDAEVTAQQSLPFTRGSTTIGGPTAQTYASNNNQQVVPGPTWLTSNPNDSTPQSIGQSQYRSPSLLDFPGPRVQGQDGNWIQRTDDAAYSAALRAYREARGLTTGTP